MTAPRSILIVRLSSLGDILHTLPAFQNLRSTFQHARIDWVVEHRVRFLLKAVPGVDRIHVIDTRSIRDRAWHPEPWQHLFAAIREMRARNYDVALDFQGLLKTALLTALSGARMRIGFPRDLVRERPADWFYTRHAGTGEPAHIVTLNRRLAEAAGAAPADSQVRLRISEEDQAFVHKYLQEEKLSDFVVINPGGGWPTKVWAPRHYGELVLRLHKGLGLQTVVTTGPGEESMFDAIAAAAPDAKPVHARLSFLQLVPMLQRARLMVAGDTGPFHLACLLGTPVVGILGPTSTVRNGPWSPLDESVSRKLPCGPCHLRTCPTRNECMDIPVDDVFRAVGRRLTRSLSSPRGGMAT